MASETPLRLTRIGGRDRLERQSSPRMRIMRWAPAAQANPQGFASCPSHRGATLTPLYPGAFRMHIVVLPGTNRAGSLTRTLADRVSDHYRELGHAVDLLDLAEMGADFVTPSAYQQPTPAITALVDRFLAADGVVFLVPEYNGSYPGIVKLPYPEGFGERPTAWIGIAAGQFQGLRAVEALQAVAGYRMAYQYPRRVFIGSSYQQFDGDGQLKDEKLCQRLQDQANGFCTFIQEVGGKQAKSVER